MKYTERCQDDKTRKHGRIESLKAHDLNDKRIIFLFFYFSFLVCIVNSIRISAIFIFVLYQAYYFFNPATKWWGTHIPDIRFSFYIVLTLLIICAYKWSSLKENKIHKVPQFWFLYIMVLLYALVTPSAVFPDRQIMALDYLVTVAILVTVVYKLVRTERELDYILWGYMVFAGYLGYYVSQFGRTSSGRFQGAGMVDSPDANGVAAAIAPALVLCLYYFWVNPKFLNRVILTILGAFMANALVQLGSRGAFLGVAVSVSGFLYYLYFSKMRKKNQRMSVVFLTIFGLIGAVSVTDSAFWQRMTTMLTQSQNMEQTTTETGATRFKFWAGAWDMAKDHPFGKGSSAFIFYSPVYVPESVATGASRNRAVHSTWFEALTEIGYLGLLMLIGVVYYSLITSRRAAKRLKEQNKLPQYYKVIAIQCAFLGFIVTMTFLNRLRGEMLYWCILYCSIAYNLFYLKAEAAEKNADMENVQPKQGVTKASISTRRSIEAAKK
ncbi:O-antigen ligase family protein [Ningiella sp. W23]|uniref:O-antigen ligase family protein n=1 Tax=Ningiella sp. W23 TaxID=3023715 RepID=UPI003758042E